MEDAHGSALTNVARPRRRGWASLWPPPCVLVAWLAAFPATWGLFAAFDALLPKGAPVPAFMLTWFPGLPLALTTCFTPFIGCALLFYVLLRYADARATLYTAPVFVVCFVGSFCRECAPALGFNGIVATIAAAALVTGEALVRRLRYELVTALCLLAVAVLELFWFFALSIAAGV